jgi:hypothetical protein
MKSFVCGTDVTGLAYSRTEYTLLPLDDTRDNFIQAAANYFVQSWMCASLPEIVDVWLHWDYASAEERDHYLSHLEHLFSDGTLIDDPDRKNSPPNSNHTAPIGTFSETMLRWMRANFGPTPLLIDPLAPMPTNDGKIDFVEITGLKGDFASFKVTLWEVKSSDSQAWYHNSKIYRQLDDYPKRFFSLANCLSESYSGNDIAFKMFLKQMGKMARNRHPQVHYGVFITYDPTVTQVQKAVPGLHKHPDNHPTPSDNLCHHLVLLLIPDFKRLRMEVWRSLHLM